MRSGRHYRDASADIVVIGADPSGLVADLPGSLLCNGWQVSHLDLVTILVEEYDPAIRFFVDVLGFSLEEDTPSLTDDGRPKRWVVVRPAEGQTGVLLARADGAVQRAAIGNQMAGRVGFFLRVDDFESAYARMVAADVKFVTQPRAEGYGTVAVFTDLAGNKWDLLGPRIGADPTPQGE